MAKGLEFKLDGAKQLEGLLKDFPIKIREKVLDGAVSAGATVVRKEARKNLKQNHSVKTGTLYDSLKTQKVKGTHGVYRIFSDRRAPHAHLIEYGTGPRALKKPHKVEIDGDWVFVKHTGSVPAKPFFRPALDEHKPEVLRAIALRMAKRMAKEAEKMTRSYKTLSKSYKKRLAA